MQVSMVTHPLPQNAGADSDGAAPAAAALPPAEPQPRRAVAAPAPIPDVWDNLVLRQLREVVREADPSLPALVRAELTLDEATSRVVVQVVKIGSNEVVRQYPTEETLKLLARVREQLGPLLSASI